VSGYLGPLCISKKILFRCWSCIALLNILCCDELLRLLLEIAEIGRRRKESELSYRGQTAVKPEALCEIHHRIPASTTHPHSDLDTFQTTFFDIIYLERPSRRHQSIIKPPHIPRAERAHHPPSAARPPQWRPLPKTRAARSRLRVVRRTARILSMSAMGRGIVRRIAFYCLTSRVTIWELHNTMVCLLTLTFWSRWIELE
jgi:hypothetical protein